MLALGLHAHAVVVAAVVHPLGHVATAGRVVCLGGGSEGTAESLLQTGWCEQDRAGCWGWGGREGCGPRQWGRARVGPHLGEATAEAGGPAALGAGGAAAQALAAEDAVAALGVGAPGQVGTALHVATQEGLLILWGHRGHEGSAWLSDTTPPGPPLPGAVPWSLTRQSGVPWR